MIAATMKLSYVVVLCACVGLVSLVTGLVVTGWFAPGEQANVPESPVYSRQEFTNLVRERSRDEVLQTLGQPDRTSQDAEAEYWHYRDRIHDPVTGRTDGDAQLVLRSGRVEVINY
jgi:hypothetical protein